MNPSSNGHNGSGRGPGGRFAPGWKGGPGGNVFAAAALRLRSKLYEALTDDDVDLAVRTLRDVMQGGTNPEKVAAAKELLNRAVGKAEQFVTADVVTAAERGQVDLSFATDSELERLTGIHEHLLERANCPGCGKGRPCEKHADNWPTC
jgi:hypothetical protein